MRHLIGFNIFVIAFVACGPQIARIGYDPGEGRDNADCNVKIMKYATIDTNLNEQIGMIEITDGKFSTNCDEDEILRLLIEEACKLGADIVNITNSKQPSNLSKCYQVTAIFFRHNLQSEKADSAISASTKP